MASAANTISLVDQSIEEVAKALSREEGRQVTMDEIRRLEFQAMRKLRRELERRGLTAELIMPSSDW